MVDVSTNVTTVVVPSHVCVRRALYSMQMEKPAAIQVRTYSLCILNIGVYTCRCTQMITLDVFVVASDKGLVYICNSKGKLLTVRGALIVQMTHFLSNKQ